MDDLRSAPGYIIDSIHPMAEELSRFQRAFAPAPPDSLVGAAPTRDELVLRFIDAAFRADTIALGRMHISAAEFGWWYFPSSEFAREPYELPPALLWGQLTARSNRGITKVIGLLTNRQFQYVGHSCSETVKVQEINRLWDGCRVLLRLDRGKSQELRLFGTILERSGRFKFISYVNNL